MKDAFGREIDYLRLSVTERCNLRCRYCMPEEGICKKRHEEMLTQEEMVGAVEPPLPWASARCALPAGSRW